MRTFYRLSSPGDQEMMKRRRGHLVSCMRACRPGGCIVLGLFPFLQQALEHDVPCNNAIGDYQPLVGIRGRRL